MKNIFKFILLLLTINVTAQNPFLNLKFDKVVMYEFDGSKGGDMSIIDKMGKMAKTISKEVILNQKTITKLNKRLGNKESYGGAEAACYEPRLGFVYFLKNKAVAKVDVCLSCNRLISSVKINAQKQGKYVMDDGEILYLGEGMSKKFKEYLNQLIKSKNFKFYSK